MSSDFFSSGGNDAGAKAAFEFWDNSNVRGWEAFNRVLARGTVPMAAWWDAGGKSEFLSRVAPPAANIRRKIKLERVDWYAVLEFELAVGTAPSSTNVVIDRSDEDFSQNILEHPIATSRF